MSFRKLLGELVASVEETSNAMDRDNALGWFVLVVDNDDNKPKPVHAWGLFNTPEEALQLAAKMDADSLSGQNPTDGDFGWSHLVLPMFKESEL